MNSKLKGPAGLNRCTVLPQAQTKKNSKHEQVENKLKMCTDFLGKG